MAKELPIQFVQFREERDDFLTEGGGTSELPTWVDDNTIATNVARMQSHLGELNERFETRIYDLPILTTVEIHEKATAKSHRDSICSMLDVDSKHNVLSSISPGKLLVKIDSSVDLNKIASRFVINRNLSKSRQKGLAAIQDVKPYKAILDENIALEDVVKIQLVNYQNSHDNERSIRIFDVLCKDLGIKTEVLDYISDLRLFKADHLDQEQIQNLVAMDCVLSVTKMPTIEFLAAPDSDGSEVCLMIPREEQDYPHVGILDSGVEPIEYLAPWLETPEDNAADLLDEDINKQHGTAVASIINYGDLLEGQDLTVCSPCKLTSCIVNGDNIIYEHELIRNIIKAIQNHPEIKIWNLSQGINVSISDREYSHLAIALDDLQKKHHILICKSAGNFEFQPDGAPHRISKGAESVMSLVVGSIALEKTLSVMQNQIIEALFLESDWALRM